MIVLGLVLLVSGLVSQSGVLTALGTIALLGGLVLLVLGQIGRPVGGRRHFF